MKRKIYILFITLLYFNFSIAQNQKLIDSLSAYLSKKDDSLKLTAISDLAWEYNRLDVQKAITVSLQGLKIAEKLNTKYGTAKANADLGTSYYYKRDFDSSTYYYKIAEKLMKELGDSLDIASLYNKMAALYKEKTNYNESLKYSFESLKIYQALKNDRKIALLLNNIGTSYEGLKNYKIAIEYYNKALDYNLKEKNKNGIARNYIGLGNLSSMLGNYDEALSYYSKAEIIFRKAEWLVELAIVLNNIGNVLDEKKQYEQAIIKRKEALQIAIKTEDNFEAAKYYCYLAGTLMKAGNFNEADENIKMAESLSPALASNEIRMEIFEARSKYFFGIHNFENGNKFLLLFHELKDSLYNADLAFSIANMEVKHNTQKLRLEKAETEAENLKLNNEKLKASQQRNYLIIVSIAIMAVLGIFFYFYNQSRKRKQEKEKVSAMLASEEKERTRIARELHDGISQLLSTARLNALALEDSVAKEDVGILNTTIDLIEQSVNEVRSVSHNLMSQILVENDLVQAINNLVIQINSGKVITASFDHGQFSLSLTKNQEINLFRVIQEILNNTIKHSEAKKVDIKLLSEKNTVKLQISDNGKGFESSVIDKNNGLGWQNISARLSLINGELNLSSIKDKGTTASIQIVV